MVLSRSPLHVSGDVFLRIFFLKYHIFPELTYLYYHFVVFNESQCTSLSATWHHPPRQPSATDFVLIILAKRQCCYHHQLRILPLSHRKHFGTAAQFFSLLHLSAGSYGFPWASLFWRNTLYSLSNLQSLNRYLYSICSKPVLWTKTKSKRLPQDHLCLVKRGCVYSALLHEIEIPAHIEQIQKPALSIDNVNKWARKAYWLSAMHCRMDRIDPLPKFFRFTASFCCMLPLSYADTLPIWIFCAKTPCYTYHWPIQTESSCVCCFCKFKLFSCSGFCKVHETVHESADCTYPFVSPTVPLCQTLYCIEMCVEYK